MKNKNVRSHEANQAYQSHDDDHQQKKILIAFEKDSYAKTRIFRRKKLSSSIMKNVVNDANRSLQTLTQEPAILVIEIGYVAEKKMMMIADKYVEMLTKIANEAILILTIIQNDSFQTIAESQ